MPLPSVPEPLLNTVIRHMLERLQEAELNIRDIQDYLLEAEANVTASDGEMTTSSTPKIQTRILIAPQYIVPVAAFHG